MESFGTRTSDAFVAFVAGPSPCANFVSAAASIVLLGLPLIRFATNAILRIVGSRVGDGATMSAFHLS